MSDLHEEFEAMRHAESPRQGDPPATAELRLVLRAELEESLEGWWAASGSSCAAHGAGVLIIVSPAEAAKMQQGAFTPAEKAARIRCLLQAFGRAIAAVTGEPTSVVDVEVRPGAVGKPRNDPRTS